MPLYSLPHRKFVRYAGLLPQHRDGQKATRMRSASFNSVSMEFFA